MLIARPPKTYFKDDKVSTTNFRQTGTSSAPGSTGSPEQLGTYNIVNRRAEYEYRGWDNEHYYRLLASGKLIPPTPWYAYKHSFEVLGGVQDVSMYTVSPYYRYWTVGWPYTWQSLIPQPWIMDQVAIKNLLPTIGNSDYYVQAAAAKIYSQGWDALTFGAELSKTVVMFRAFLTRWADLARTGKLESLWLEGRYGWRPLVYDIQDINKAIKNLNEGRKRFRDHVGQNTTRQWDQVNTINTVYGVLTCTTKYTDTFGIRGSIVADIEPPRIQFNPLVTAWELMKLSFVIDWVLNVGQFLESLSFLALSREYYATAGFQVKRQYVQSSTFVPASGCIGTWWTSSRGEATLTQRIPTSVSTIPLPKLRLGAFKVLDLVALFIQAVTRGRR